jgi:hypothetical protein
MNRSLLQVQIRQDLPQEDADICLGILNDLLFGDWDLDHITFHDLSFWSPDSDNPKELMALLSYLTGDRTHLLDMKMYFQDGDTRYELSGDRMKAASKGSIFHPVTNEALDYEEAAAKVFMYFVASDLIKGLRK